MPWWAVSAAVKRVSGDGRSVQPSFSAPGTICSKPSASTQSTAPLATACRASHKAVEPVAQLLFTLTTGMPDMPTPYSAACPAVLSP